MVHTLQSSSAASRLGVEGIQSVSPASGLGLEGVASIPRRRRGGGGGGASVLRIQKFESQLLRQSFPSVAARQRAESQFRQTQQRAEQQKATQLKQQTEQRAQSIAAERPGFLQRQVSRARGLVSDVLTREQFIRPRQETALQTQLGKRASVLGTLTSEQVKSFAELPGTGVSVEPFTPIGGGLSFTVTPTQAEIKAARSQAESQFGKLSRKERIRLRTGGVFIGGVRGGLKFAEFSAELPFELGAGRLDVKGKSLGGADFDFIPEKLKGIPVGGLGRGAQFATEVGLPLVLGGAGIVGLAKKGFTAKQIAGEFAQSFSLLRVKPGVFVPKQILRGRGIELQLGEVGVSTVKAKGLLDPTETIRGFAVGKGGKTQGLFEVDTPFIEIGRGGKIETGIKKQLVRISGKTGKPSKVNVLIGEVEFAGAKTTFDLLGRAKTVKVKVGEEFIGRTFQGFADTFPSGKGGRVVSTTLEKKLGDLKRIDIGRVGIEQQDILSITGKSGIDFRTEIISPIRRFTFTGEGIPFADKATIGSRIKTGKKKSSKQFLNQLFELETTNVLSLAGAAKSKARLNIITKTPRSVVSSFLPGPGAFGVMKQFPSPFAGTGRFEKTQEFGFVFPKQRQTDLGLVLSEIRPQRDVDLLGVGRLELERIDLLQRQKIGARSSMLGVTPRTRQINILKEISGQLTGQVPGQATGQIQISKLKLDAPLDIPLRSTTRTGLGFIGGGRGRFGFLPFPPPVPGTFPGFKKRARVKRKLKRTPSFISILTGFEAPRKLPGEETGLIARPILKKKRKKKRR